MPAPYWRHTRGLKRSAGEWAAGEWAAGEWAAVLFALSALSCTPNDHPIVNLQTRDAQHLASAAPSPNPGTKDAAGATTSSPTDAAAGASASQQLDPDFGVPLDEWSRVEAAGECNLQVALHPEHVWPGFTFEPASAHVDWASALPGPSASLFNFGLRLGNGRDQSVLSAPLMWLNNPRRVVVTIDARTGKALGMVSTSSSSCNVLVLSARLNFIADNSTGDNLRYGWLAPDGNFAWQLLRGESLSDAFDTGERWGLVYGLALIRVSSNPPTGELHDVYTSPRYIRTPVGKDGILFWTEMGTIDGRVMALGPDDQVHELVVPETYFPQKVAISDDTLAWVGVEGPLVIEGGFERAVVYQCPWSSLKDTCEPKAVAELPFDSGTGNMEITDRWIAVPGCKDYVCSTIVIDRRDNSLHKLRAPGDLALADVIGIVDDTLYARGYTQKAIGTGFFERLLRFDLTHLKDFSDAL